MKRKSSFFTLLLKHRFTALSLIIILGMYGIMSILYSPDNFLRVSAINIANGHIKNVGGPFKLKTHTGKTFTEKHLENKVSLIFFGYTHCLDICPKTLTKLSNIYEALPKDASQKLQIVFVTLDPNRDTRKKLNTYIKGINSKFIGLTGTEEDINDMAKKYSVYHVKSKPTAEGHYMIDHTSYVYLMDKNGDYEKHFSIKTSAEEILTETFTALRQERKKHRKQRYKKAE